MLLRKVLFGCIGVLVVAASVFVSASAQDERSKVRLRLVDAANGQGVGGIVRVTDTGGKMIELPGLFDRMAGLTKDLPGVHWYVIPAAGAETTLPREKLQLRAVSGVETATADQELDLRANAPAEVTLKLPFLFHPEEMGLVAGNTHLHLRGFTLETADEYLRRIPAADGLRVLFISYLERDKDDATYITNRYPIGDLPRIAATGLLVNNGEEHRHNFQGYGEGYGHVMFLNIKELVKPVSLGPGITGQGFDDVALRAGLDEARKQGGTVLWCHNTFGFEDVPSALTGRFDALNVFDGSRTGKYEDNYYRYLNIGLRMPISTGTDWFMYDFSRVYADVRGKLTIPAWLDAVKAGRCQATNGPLLTLRVDGKTMGDVIDLKEPRTVSIEASAVGRHPLQRLQLIHNGRVVRTQAATGAAATGAAPGRIRLEHQVRLDEPAWFAVRVEADAKNEFEKVIFAHSSPVYVTLKGRGVFDLDAALGLLKQVEEGHAAIKGRGRFSSPDAERRLLTLYDAAMEDLRGRINARR
jgi:hypothetical protein